MRSVLAGLLLPAALVAQTRQSALSPDQQLAHDIYKELIEINTVDSIGSTTPAAAAVARRFRDAGFPAADVVEIGARPDKGNLIVRYRGNGPSDRKPLLLLAHLDVVPALQSDWSPDIDPFKLTERDGYYYGRGTGDNKASASIFAATLLRFKQEGFVPDRDIVLALTTDEEIGGKDGIRWLLANHRELIDAAYALNEGAGGFLRDGKPFINFVAAEEKTSHGFTLTVSNRGGPSAVARDDNAIYELAQALLNVARLQFPVMLSEATRGFFAEMANLEAPDMAAAMRAILANPGDANAAAAISTNPRYRAMLRTTCVATTMAAGQAKNALPQKATANLNCRLLPGDDPAGVRAKLIEAINDTAVQVSPAPVTDRFPPSPLTPEVMRPMAEVTREVYGAGVPLIPTLTIASSESKYLRLAGIPTYGISGLMGDPNDLRTHGKDERVLVKSYYQSEDFLYRLVKALSKSPAAP